jgi:hypothetical protein
MGYPVNAPSEIDAFLVPSIIRDITTTRQKISLPSGAKWANISYRLLPGATAVANQFLKAVINASSDADADGKLATDNTFVPVFQGDDVTFSAKSGSLITRIDLITEAAVGAEKTVVRVLAGV